MEIQGSANANLKQPLNPMPLGTSNTLMHTFRDNTAAAPRPGCLTVWRLDSAADFPPGWEAVLSHDERRRADAMTDPAARRQYLAGRLALRAILGRCTGRPPAALIFTRGPHQKPELAPMPGAPAWRFSLAHTRGMILIAAGAGGAIGVDVESRRRRLRNFEGLIRRNLTPAEQQAVQSRPPAGRQALFLHYWTAKEACLKAIGTGLARPPKTLHVNIINQADAVCRPADATGDWRIKFFAPAPGFLAAVAARLPEFRLKVRNFSLDLRAAMAL